MRDWIEFLFFWCVCGFSVYGLYHAMTHLQWVDDETQVTARQVTKANVKTIELTFDINDKALNVYCIGKDEHE